MSGEPGQVPISLLQFPNSRAEIWMALSESNPLFVDEIVVQTGWSTHTVQRSLQDLRDANLAQARPEIGGNSLKWVQLDPRDSQKAVADGGSK
ncbi:hypothetical protein EL22_25385 [Halostagnicola sp. A56]|uniref:ArsR family transcriptional regulator n=1 Tax=Halostagnicola sp. A56 TaxID=1495067 RepID=UPI00049EE378|nr:ArsR family transcriptional regulator [Halostagnicola sp. A56]KDE56704.1 hypothetical protein EL22_25385 [Halostagnicola sp. A56]